MIHYITTEGIGQAWVGTELKTLERAGIPFKLHAMRQRQHIFFDSDWAEKTIRETNTLYPLPLLSTALAFVGGPFLFGPRFLGAFLNAVFGPRESFRVRMSVLAHFVAACYWARGLRCEAVSHIHSQWVHSSGSIGMFGAWLLGKSFSFTGHAADLYRERAALRTKIQRAEFIVCISEYHRAFYLEQGARPEQLFVAYCGIDVSHFRFIEKQQDRGRPCHIVSSGRLVEKKGFTCLLDAVKILRDRGMEVRCTIGGSGPLQRALEDQARVSGIADIVDILGQELTQEALPEFMNQGDLYCLPCVWASDNDVDGLPQMLMEAMACGMPAVSTRLVGIPDLIVDGETGLLVEPNDAHALANALRRLIEDPELARRLAAQGRARIEHVFNLETCLEPLIARYREKIAETVRV